MKEEVTSNIDKNSVMLRLFTLVLGCLLLFQCQSPSKSDSDTSAGPPNIIYIMSDDHAKKAISVYGSDLLQTPNIDRIAREGMLFNRATVTNSICAPSRATMLTGKFSHLNGLRDNRDQFDGTQLTFPKLLQGEGYHTGIIGKWHLKTKPTGFDVWKVLMGQGEYYQPRIATPQDTAVIPGYTTTVITDLALDFLENRPDDQPFCLLYHHKAPHRNWMPDVDDLAMYADEDIPEPSTLFDEYQDRPAAAAADMRIRDMFLSGDMKLHPDSYPGKDTNSGGAGVGTVVDREKGWAAMYARLTTEQREKWDAHYGPINEDFKNNPRTGKELIRWKYQRYMKDYLRTVKSVDDNIGRLLEYLDENDLTDNTILVYTSDQGFYLGEHGWYDKRFMYEESFGTPLMVRYPSHIKAGSVSEALVQNLDFAPTFLDYAGVKIPEEMQGESMRTLLEEGNDPAWRDAVYYQYFEYPHGWHTVKKHYGISTNRYKLIHFYDDIDHWELYDLQQDPEEMDNRYGDPALENVQQDLLQRLGELRKKYKVTS